MSLYPSLEDMKVDHMAQAQMQHSQAQAQAIQYPQQGQGLPYPVNPTAAAYPQSSLYPSLNEYMGLSLDEGAIPPAYGQVVPSGGNQLAVRQTQTGNMQVAPVTGNDVGLRRAEIKQGIRMVTLCKDQQGKCGLRVRGVNKGVFVAFVHVNSPAALAGLRFGDQILEINNQLVAGWDTDKVMKFIKNAAPEKISMAVRDRPFERTLTMQKDSVGHIGFVFNNGKINSIVKDSSAARNGILTEHQLIEVNGQNVVGLKDSETRDIFAAAPRTVTVTIMPSFIYEHIVKCMGSSLVKKLMDHSIPDI
ncbi:syntenin-1 [Lingula anatina]|uniref:Syntenin-1 n=1 Tax=Lingula anatina TaxID=7574 RepID=A0A1S3IIY4_LINAN|nr:syntenin-1 [Lingula anatina]XP_013398173.1 syntenin-1 [Lingula anatina]|eukprot:XP_013398172.1 syntenin-1 [Lingula anatina]